MGKYIIGTIIGGVFFTLPAVAEQTQQFDPVKCKINICNCIRCPALNREQIVSVRALSKMPIAERTIFIEEINKMEPGASGVLRIFMEDYRSDVENTRLESEVKRAAGDYKSVDYNSAMDEYQSDISSYKIILREMN